MLQCAWRGCHGNSSSLTSEELLIEGGELAEGFYNFTVPSRHHEMHGSFFITPVGVIWYTEQKIYTWGWLFGRHFLGSRRCQISSARVGDGCPLLRFLYGELGRQRRSRLPALLISKLLFGCSQHFPTCVNIFQHFLKMFQCRS